MTARTFAYHRAIAPMMWVLVGLSSVELVVVHALLAWWHPWIAVAASLLTLGGIAWLVAAIRSFARLPVTIDDDTLLMRVGRLHEASVPVANIAGLRSAWTAQTVKARDVLNLALIAYPNVVVDLRAPVAVGRRRIAAIAHRLDDPAGFADALDALRRRHD